MIPAPFVLALALAAPPGPTPQQSAPAAEEAVLPDEAGNPDIVLHVPRAEVGKLALDVENLEARLDVNTRVANLVQIEAGIVANVGKLKMQLEQVASEARLVVRLDRVARIMERALGAIDEHPDLGGLPPREPPPADSARSAPRIIPPAEPVPARADGAAASTPSPNPVQE